MSAYYNELEPYAAQWLRNLIAAGHIAPGDVDERSITEVQPDELRGYTQCHFFAGIGGWSYALRLAGFPDGRPIWTGSCPCQPFSSSGSRKGHQDERHLWPAWFRLIGECSPSAIYGEQVAGTDGLGWLDLASSDLESAGYAVAAADLTVAGIGAPHVRQRIYWTAARPNADRDRLQGRRAGARGTWNELEFARLVQDQVRVSAPSGRHLTLVDGVPGGLGQLRAYGNAIVPQVAAIFVRAAA